MTPRRDARARATGSRAASSSKASGALVVGFSARARSPTVSASSAQGQFGTQRARTSIRGSSTRGSRIAADGSVTAYTGKCELGQGMLHGADAADRRGAVACRSIACTLDPVRHRADARSGHDVRQPVARRRTSTSATWRWPARPRARRWCGWRPTRLGVPVDQLDGRRRRRSASTSDRVEAGRPTASSSADSKFDLPLEPEREAEAAERVDGARHAGAARRHAGDGDRPASSTSTTCACPGCCTARVVRPPAVGATLVERRRELGRGMPGVVKVVVRKNFVGVVAEKPWQAMQAARDAEGDVDAPAPACRRSASFYDYLRTAAVARHARRRLAATSTQTLGARARRSSRRPICIRTRCTGRSAASCAVADVQADAATIWSATQSAYPTRSSVGDAARRAGRATCASSSRGARAATASTAPTPCRTTRRCCRRRSAGRCACSSRARTRWRGRTTASPT